MLPANKLYRFNDFTLNPINRSLFRAADEIKINERDFDVLIFLIEKAPRFCSFDEIIQAVWNGTNVGNNSVEKIITNLRKAFGDDKTNSRFIKTGRGRGYAFICPVCAIEEKASTPSYKSFENTNRPGKYELLNQLPEKRALNSKSLIFGISLITLFFIFSGLFWWKGNQVLARFDNKTILFADNFSGDNIDVNRWTAEGKTVKVENGSANLAVEETDNWGRLKSNYFAFDVNKPITIKSRVKVSYSKNLKDRFYFHGYFGLTPKTSLTNNSQIKNTLFLGIKYVNYDYESKYPDGNTDNQKAEGFFLVKKGGDPTKRIDYETGKVSSRVEPVWDKWFEQKIVYEPFSGNVKYFINSELKQEFNAGKFSTDLPENKLRLEINPEGWWLYHSIEISDIEVSQ